MPDTSFVRTQTRILKTKATEIAIAILQNANHELYKETFLTVLKNTVPRTQEITGEEGESISIVIAKPIAEKNNINVPDTLTNTDSTGYPQV